MRRRRPYAPVSLPSPKSVVRLWPRTPPINRHAIDRALHVAAWGTETCRPFLVPLPRKEVTPGS